ncbi:tetratricopeptide repeat protein [Caenimonas koreensis]|uniref:tetratricopeptide repeat protein n=1 Tax=Caenimonas koreensis TaxID=367474 RepID=UPI003782E038
MFIRQLKVMLVALLAMTFAAFASAQGEPTIKQIYETAQAGQLDKARQMTQEVLRNHPKSAKAHFVMAELDAAQGHRDDARESLAQAESIAPGLPFARPEAVQALRSRLAAPQAAARTPKVVDAPATVAPRESPRPAPSFPWGMLLIAGMVAIVVAYVMRSRAQGNAANAANAAPVAPMPDNAWGRQPEFGTQAAYGNPPGYGTPPAYGTQPGYGAPPAYGQPQGSGLGGRVMGGLATGLAVGAGALAAQEIGRRIMGDHESHRSGAPGNTAGSASHSTLADDAGFGAIDESRAGASLPDNFGITDGGSWDDGGSGGGFDGGGADGGSWDS